jgi:hypothetical protein
MLPPSRKIHVWEDVAIASAAKVITVILANADLPYVYNDLLPQDRSAEAFLQKQFSCSAISFF